MLGSRELFPDLAAVSYLNHAAISPASRPVVEAVEECVGDYARRGLDAFPRWLGVRQRLRERLARLVGARPEDLALVPNTTSGVLDVALCFPWEPGDRVLVFEGEFPANVTPWQQAGVEVRFLPMERAPDPDVLTPLEEALRGGARLVAVSAVQFQTGLRMPLPEISALCRRHGAALFVDGIQAVGVVPLDVQGIDFLACGSHKWLMGLEGAGFLYVSPDQAPHLRPRVAGWLSHEDPLSFLTEGAGLLRYDRPVRRSPDFLEPGTGNAVGHAALEASTALLEALGVPAIHRHVNGWLDALEEGLGPRGFTSFRPRRPEARSGILSVLPPPGLSVQEACRGLAEGGISCTTPDGFLRFAPHWPNSTDEVPRVLAEVDRVLEGARARPV